MTTQIRPNQIRNLGTGGGLDADLLDGQHATDFAPVAHVHAFQHIQMVAADVWTIVHPLNKKPSVTVVDSAGTVVMGDVEYTSNIQVVVRFSAPFSGTAELN